MRLAKIKNKYLYKSGNPHGYHTYAVYYDKKNKETRAVGLTHLYVKDKKRFSQLKQGVLMSERFKEFKDVPSGVRNGYISRDINGNKIKLTNPNVVRVSKRYLPKSQAERIKRFARKDFSK